MATIIPSNIDAIENSTERYMAQIMSDALVDDEIYIIHGQQTSTRTKNGIILGEADFILISPEYGLLIIEVKGGDVHFNPNNPEKQQWGYGRDARVPLVSSDPIYQGRNNLTTILNIIRRSIPDFSRLYANGYAIALPESYFEGTIPPGITQEMLLTHGKCQLETIRESIFTLFRALRQKKEKETGNITHLNKVDIQKIFDTLTPVYKLTPIRYRIFEEYERKIHALTEDQTSILDTLINQPKAAIAGVAGSGKTFLAISKAQSEAIAGKRVLFLCYNKALAEWLNATIDTNISGEGSLLIDNYHSFAATLYKTYNFKWNTNSSDFWTTGVANQLFQIAENWMTYQAKFDTIIVDEGQDFHPSWWMSIEKLFRGDFNSQWYYVFYDPDQNIYQGPVNLPDALTLRTYPLITNCRNTKRISDHCAQIINNQMRTKVGAPIGIEPLIKFVPNLNTAWTHAEQLVGKMIAEEHRLQKKQVAVLLDGVNRSQQKKFATQFGFTDNPTKWRNNEGVLVIDAGAFKGLESDAVIIIEQNTSNTAEANSKRYVARSRAKFELTIFNINDNDNDNDSLPF